ncbi:LysR family transcriptional regulator [Rhizobium brockwellii]|uniref:LysR family transcriptional regulator n=1 Tax=Rhizobium brockwellii TaxID=3019932 RepID=UPI00293DFF44|nr:LysR family transcriptional regulator [Rhizobium brockwellii]MDV4154761.1 LysR family transcriptional regulator [Rhizobium brockwellii]
MDDVDLNLLRALDALLAEGGVTGAARRLGLSRSAMSRTLARLRSVTGDPLLVRAGRGLVATPYAAKLRERVPALSREVLAVLRPAPTNLDIASLERTFTIRANEGFVAGLSVALVAAITKAAPRMLLRFAPKPEKDARPLREGQIDLEIGVLGAFAPEVRTRSLFRDSFVGLARIGHPLLSGAEITAESYAACDHVVTSRKGEFTGPVDDALAELGLQRKTSVVVPGFPDAMQIARHSDLVALVPRSCLGTNLENGQTATAGLQSFDLPVRTPEIVVSAMWHPRMDADAAHRWFRDTVVSVCRSANPRR